MSPEIITTITTTISTLLASMGLSATVQAEDTATKGWVFSITPTEDAFALIGHRGSHLHALEVLVHALVGRQFPGQFIYFSLDVDDYRRKREWYVKETVHAAVKQLQLTGRAQGLIPMPNYERKYVHSLLQEHYPELTSESVGFDPRRRVVIKRKS